MRQWILLNEGDYMKTRLRKILIWLLLVVLITCYSFIGTNSTSHAKGKNAGSYLLTPTDDGKNQVTHPDMVYIEGGFAGYKYWMACTPYPHSNQYYENPYILVSNDGISFTKPEGEGEFLVPPPNDWAKGGHYSDTDMYYADGKLVLYFVHNVRGVAGPSKFYRMESSDGINWSTPEVFYTCNETIEGYSPACIREYDKTVKMWYVGGEGNFVFTQSPDNERTWYEVRKCVIDMKGWRPWHVDVAKTNIGYEGLMCAKDPGKNIRALFFIASTDGIYWNSSKEPVLYPDKDGWDSREIYRASLVKDQDTNRIWYSARGAKEQWHVGYTTIDMNEINIEKPYTTRPWRGPKIWNHVTDMPI